MKNCKSAKICAYVSLAISVVLAILWICNVGGLTVVTLETFVGVIVALLAIIVTLAIVWQIYNAVEMKNKVAELKQLEGQLEEQKKALEQYKFATSCQIYVTMGIVAGFNKLNIASFRFLNYSLEASMQLDEPKDIDAVLTAMDELANSITTEKDSNNQLESITKTYNSIRSLPNYELIKGRYEQIYNKFISKIEKVEEQK